MKNVEEGTAIIICYVLHVRKYKENNCQMCIRKIEKEEGDEEGDEEEKQ